MVQKPWKPLRKAVSGACLNRIVSLVGEPPQTSEQSTPVFRINVASGIAGDATTVNDDTEEHEAETGGDLEQTKYELDLFQLARPRPVR
jgi:hypothetical protein